MNESTRVSSTKLTHMEITYFGLCRVVHAFTYALQVASVCVENSDMLIC